MHGRKIPTSKTKKRKTNTGKKMMTSYATTSTGLFLVYSNTVDRCLLNLSTSYNYSARLTSFIEFDIIQEDIAF